MVGMSGGGESVESEDEGVEDAIAMCIGYGECVCVKKTTFLKKNEIPYRYVVVADETRRDRSIN